MKEKNQTYTQISLQEKIFRECDVMLKHGTSKGLEVPPALIADFSEIDNTLPRLQPLKVRHRDFLSAQDVRFEPAVMQNLSHIHQQLSRIVSPATPFTLLFLQTDLEQNKGGVQVFGSVPLIRRMLFAAIFCLVVLVSMAFYPDAGKVISRSIFENASFDLVVAVIFMLASAGLGASFYALYKSRSYVTNYTFDPSYEGTYWTEFVLGLMAGLIFASILNVETVAQQVGTTAGSALILSKITLALLGGFASNTVYQFLNRIVEALASIVNPGSQEIIEAEIREAKASVKEELLERKEQLTRSLADLQTDVFSGELKPSDIGDRLKTIIKEVVVKNEYVGKSSNTPPPSATPTAPSPIVRTVYPTEPVPERFAPPPVEVPTFQPIPQPEVPTFQPIRQPAVASQPDPHSDPLSVEHFNEDDARNATDEEYISRI